MFILVPLTLLFLVAFVSLLLSINGGRLKAAGGGGGRFPPGCSGMPLIGETLSLMKPHPATSRGEFMDSRISRFGRIFSSSFFGSRGIISADPELNRFVLKNNMRYFMQGWPGMFKKLVGEGSISVIEGEAHKNMMSNTMEFLSSERVRSVFLRDMDRIALLVMGSWKEGRVFSAKDELTKLSLKIMVKNILSMTDEEEIGKLQKEYDRFLRGLTSLPLYLPGTTYWKAFQARKNILKVFKQEIERRKANMDDRNSRPVEDDYLGWLLKNTSYSEGQLGDMLLSLLFAGHDTSSRAITGMIYFLHGCPSAIEQLREEHRQRIRSKMQKGETKFTWDDYKDLEFTKCVVNETLRLSSISVMIPKVATEDVEFKGFVIPKGCTVMLHNKAVHLDPSLYENPEHFNPWRWLSLSSTHITNNFMPFGGGVRLCPGAELAKLELSIFLHHLVLKYDWELAETDHPMNLPFMEFPKGLLIKVRATSTT